LKVLETNPELILSRLEAKEPLLAVAWTFGEKDANGESFVSAKRQRVNADITSRLREERVPVQTIGSDTPTLTPTNAHQHASNVETQRFLAFALPFVRSDLEHYGGDYLSGGRFHPETMSPELKSQLEEANAACHSMAVERAFAYADRANIQLGGTVGASLVSTASMLSFNRRSFTEWYSKLTRVEKDALRSHSLVAGPKLTQEARLNKKTARNHATAAEATKLEEGREAERNRILAASAYQDRSAARYPDAASIHAALADALRKEKKEMQKQQDGAIEIEVEVVKETRRREVLKDQLQVYANAFSKHIVKGPDEELVELCKIKDAEGLSLYQQTFKSKPRSLEVLTANLVRLVVMCSGKTVTAESLNPLRKTAIDTRVLIVAQPVAQLVHAAETSDAFLTRRASQAQQQSAKAAQVDRVRNAKYLAIPYGTDGKWRKVEPAGNKKVYFYHIETNESAWHPL
jgi:hypothetical protein